MNKYKKQDWPLHSQEDKSTTSQCAELKGHTKCGIKEKKRAEKVYCKKLCEILQCI